MIVTLSGTNKFQISQRAKRLIVDFVQEHGDLALERFDGGEAEYNQLLGAIESLPFLATKKMVVIADLSSNKTAVESLEQLIERAGDTTDVLIVESKLDKRSVYYKLLKKVTDFIEYSDLDESQLATWLTQEATNQNARLSSSDARYLVQRVGTDQLRLSNDLYKLSQYDATITRTAIDLLTTENPASTIFNLIDSVFSGNIKQALAIYDEQRRMRVEPQYIHAMLVWQMHTVAITSAAPKGVSSNDIAKQSGISPYVIQKSQRIAQKMGHTKIIECMQLLRDIDYKSKRQTFDYDEALRYLFVSLAA